LRTFGDQLREAREARGHSLQAVADATRIVVRHLEALERSDVEALPAGPFARGYIEAYAQFLRVEPGPILEAYHAIGHRRGLDVPETRDRVFAEFSELMEERAKAVGGGLFRGWKGLTLGLVAVGLVGLGGGLLMRHSGSELAPAPVSPGETTPPGESISEGDHETRAAPSGEQGAELARAEPTPTEKAIGRPEPPAAGSNSPEPSAVRTAPAELEVSHSGVGTGVESSRLVGRGSRFTEGTPVVFWTRVLGGRPGDVIRHVWLHEGQTVGFADLQLGGSHWRTYSRRELPEGATGRWVVEARSLEGEVLAREEFLCIPRERP
jgi:cytoskeletal protein RodZ